VPADGIDQDCRGGDAPAPRPLPPVPLPPGCTVASSRLNVLALTIDALRADAFTAEVMPALSELSKNALTFERAYSPTAMTYTSVPAILSGQPFADVGPQNVLLDENLTPMATAPELFRAAGYRTAAISEFFDHIVFRRGFDTVNSYWHDLPIRGVKGSLTSAAMSRGILDALSLGPQPVLVWAHLADTHAHYSLDHDEARRELPESTAYYRGAAYVDLQLGKLLSDLQQQGRLQQTIIAVLADHGEELLTRGRQGHGPNLFEESIHVPLVLWAPNCPAQRVAEPVSLAHLMPTVAALAGVSMPGRALLPIADLPVVVEGVTGLNTTYKRAVIQGHFKLLLDVTNGGRMLFDLQRDPQELNNILADSPEIAEALELAYQRWLDAPGRR
jgi:arylsulfatase A-like enzyme